MLGGLVALAVWLGMRQAALFTRRLIALNLLRQRTEEPVMRRDEPDDLGFMEGTLTGRQHDVIRDSVVNDSRLKVKAKKALVDALDAFRPTDLPPASLDWSEAERRGCTEADLFWDLARGRDAA